MLKALLASTLFLVLGDIAITHGENTMHVVHMFKNGIHWIANAGENSIFAD